MEQTIQQLKAENQLLRQEYEKVILTLREITRVLQSMTGTSGSGPEETSLLKSILNKNPKNNEKKQKRRERKEKEKQQSITSPVTDYEWSKRYDHPLWKRRAQQIKRRDQFTCTACNSTNSLHVHHLLYQPGLHVWEYPGEYLVTLCSKCHEKAHEGKDISEFINKGIPIPKYKLIS